MEFVRKVIAMDYFSFKPTQNNGAENEASALTTMSHHNILAKICREYVPVHPAGSGCKSDVFYAIPAPAVVSAKSELKKGHSYNMANLKAQLVAIKIPDPRKCKVTAVKNERHLLEFIQEISEKNGCMSRCVQSIRQDGTANTSNECTWLAISTSASAFSLRDFEYYITAETIPRSLIFHIFIEMVQALKFLHHTCKPSIAHNDLHLGNIMLDPSRTTYTGFPNIMLIDFENATSPSHSEQRAWDRMYLYAAIYELCEHTIPTSDLPLTMEEFYNEFVLSQAKEEGKLIKAEKDWWGFWRFLYCQDLYLGRSWDELAMELNEAEDLFGEVARRAREDEIIEAVEAVKGLATEKEALLEDAIRGVLEITEEDHSTVNGELADQLAFEQNFRQNRTSHS